MFLHEPGEDNESFTRQDLSSMNVYSTQQPSSEHSPPQPPPPVVPVAAAHMAARNEVNDTPSSPVDGLDRPALPSTASWASKPPQMSRQQSSAGRSVIAHQPSPIVAAATPRKDPVKPEPIPEPVQQQPSPPHTEPQAAPIASPQPAQPPPPRQRKQPQASAPLVELLKSFANSNFTFDFSTSRLTEQEIDSIKTFPSLFDQNGGAKRRALRLREEEDRRRLEQEAQLAMQAAVAAEAEEHEGARGSLQLGGEPEEPEDIDSPQHNPGPSDMSALNTTRGLTPQQHQQLLLQQLKAPSAPNQPSFPQQIQSGNPPGHARNVSRYTFANDTPSASASVKPVANSKLMNQQSSMMPPQTSLGQQPPAGFFSSNVQGPPPGLKTTGTPPFSGGGMFGQGHGFATSGLGYGANLTGRSPNDEMMRDLLRTRNLGGGGASQVSSDAGKREYMFPSFLHHSHPSSQASTPAPHVAHAHAPGLLNMPYGMHQSQVDGVGPGQNVAVKPKKKGKKHRHANTSSSGGGALSAVDVSDPSILQARLHQAQAAGQHGGQGLPFAGQGAGQGGLQNIMYGGAGFGGRW